MNLRRLTLCALGASVGLGLLAVPAKRGTRVFTQADGTKISLQLVGDENFHTLCTVDGLAVMRQADGNFYYRSVGGVTDVRASEVSLRSEAELQFIKDSAPQVAVDVVMRSGARTPASQNRVRGLAAPRKASQVPSVGSPRVPVLLVQYKDYRFKDTDPRSTFVDFFTSGTTSARQYFVDQSNGKYTPQFDVYGPVTLSGNRSVYGGNDWYGNDQGVGQMVGEACLGLDSQIDFSKYDNDGDGECDVVIVIYAGDGEASSYDEDCENAVWPCQWSLSSSDYGKSEKLDNTTVDKFAVFNELNGLDLSRLDGIGTFCHEFSHCLDLPDFYDTNYSGYFGMAHWSLLDYGCYNDDGYTPVGYTAYEKAFMGWIELEEAAENTYYTLPVFNQKNLATDKAVKVTNPQDQNEYYIIENRANQGWDKYMPAEGLLITHVTYSSSAWNSNTVNNYAMQRMTPIPADNLLRVDKETYQGQTYYVINEADLKGDLWPYGTSTELTDTSFPAAKVNTGSYMGKPLTEMVRNADGTISFWAMRAPRPSVAAPQLADHNVESPTSLTVNWAAGDENDVTYTLEIKEHRDITYELVESVTFSQDNKNHGWSTSGYTALETDGIRLGSSNRVGGVESPSFTVTDDGEVTVFVNSKSYGSDKSSLKISLLNASGAVVDSKTVSLTTTHADYVALLKGVAGTKMSVAFESTATKKRLYVKSAEIYTGDATSLKSMAANAAVEAGDDTSRTITGITATSYKVEGLKENGVYDYRIKAIPTDGDTFAESLWTETATANLAIGSVIGSVSVDEVADAPAEYYNMQGIRVSGAGLMPGVYVVKRGESVSKILVR